MSDPNDDRRVHRRYQVLLPVTLQLIFPEDTFSVREHPAIAMDISLGGCRIRTNSVDRSEYQKLLSPMRFAKVIFVFRPGTRAEMRGKLVWMDYHDASAKDVAHCLLGVSFTAINEDFKVALEERVMAMGQLV